MQDATERRGRRGGRAREHDREDVYEKSVSVINHAQVRSILMRAEANTRAYPFFLTDLMNGCRTDGAVVSLQTYCFDALFRTATTTHKTRDHEHDDDARGKRKRGSRGQQQSREEDDKYA